MLLYPSTRIFERSPRGSLLAYVHMLQRRFRFLSQSARRGIQSRCHSEKHAGTGRRRDRRKSVVRKKEEWGKSATCTVEWRRKGEAERDESAYEDKREQARDAENRVGEIGCSCILTSRREVAMRSDSPISPTYLFVPACAKQGGWCLRYPLDGPEIQFADGGSSAHTYQISHGLHRELLFAILFSLNIFEIGS